MTTLPTNIDPPDVAAGELRRGRTGSIACLVVVAVQLFALLPPAHAQDTRTAVIERQLTEKATMADQALPETNTLERSILFLETSGLIERIGEGLGGLYPRFGKLSPASGFGAGAGYRHRFTNEATLATGFTLSGRGYKALDAQLVFPPLFREHVTPTLSIGYRDYPQERFFGLGSHSSRADRAHYRLEDTRVLADATVRVAGPVALGFGGGFLNIGVGPGRGDSPSIAELFTDAEAPGLSQQPSYVFYQARASLDYRDELSNARAGGVHTVQVIGYIDRDLDRYSFRQYTVQLVQYLPFFDRRRVIALRARGEFADAITGHHVPFYLMPTLGGPETLRGFREYRFRDANLLLFTAEYRWEAFAALDMALFVDTGHAAAHVKELALNRLDASYGLGFRFSTRRKLLMRFDIGRGSEGTRYFLRFLPVF